MLRAIGRNTTLVGALIVGATIGGLSAKLVVSPRGALGPTILQADSVVRALVGAAIALISATVLGAIVGRVSNAVVGMFVFGGAMFGFAWRFEPIMEIARTGSLTLVAIETALWSLPVLGAAIVVFRVAGPLPDVEPDEDGQAPDPFRSAAALRMAAAGLLVLPVVWIVAQSGTKGQVLGAVFCGSMVAGLVGRLLSPHVQPILLFAAPILFGAIGHVVGIVRTPGPLEESIRAGVVSPLSLPMPADYAAATAMGVAFGLGWARSFLHHEDEAHETAPAT